MMAVQSVVKSGLTELCEFLSRALRRTVTLETLSTVIPERERIYRSAFEKAIRKTATDEAWAVALAWVWAQNIEIDDDLPTDVKDHKDDLLQEGAALFECALSTAQQQEDEAANGGQQDMRNGSNSVERMGELINENCEMFQRVSELEKEREELRSELESCKSTCSKLEKDLLALRVSLTSTERDEELHKVFEQNRKLKMEIAELKHAEVAARPQPQPSLSRQDPRVSKLEQELKDVKAELRSQIAQCNEEQENARRHSARASTLEERLKKLSASQAKARKDAETAAKQAELLRNEMLIQVENLQRQLIVEQQSTNWAPRLSISNFTECPAPLESLTDSLAAHQLHKLETLSQEAETLRSELREAEQRIEELNRSLSEAKDREATTALQHAQALAQACDQQALRTALKEAQRTAVEAEQVFKQRLREMQYSLQRSEMNCTTLTAEVARLKTALAESVPRNQLSAVQAEAQSAARALVAAQQAAADMKRELEHQQEAARAAMAKMRQIEIEAEKRISAAQRQAAQQLPKMSSSAEREEALAAAMQKVEELNEVVQRSQQAMATAEQQAADARQHALDLKRRLTEIERQREVLKIANQKEIAAREGETREKRKLQTELQKVQQQLDSLCLRKANNTDRVTEKCETLAVLRADLERGAQAVEAAAAAASEREEALQAVLRQLLALAKQALPAEPVRADGSEAVRALIARTTRQKEEARKVTLDLAKQLRESEAECNRLREALRKGVTDRATDARKVFASVQMEVAALPPRSSLTTTTTTSSSTTAGDSMATTAASPVAARPPSKRHQQQPAGGSTPLSSSAASSGQSSAAGIRKDSSAPRMAKGDCQLAHVENEAPRRQQRLLRSAATKHSNANYF